jgi:hypothetical protein
MFPYLPEDLEIKILREYSKRNIIPHLNDQRRILKQTFRESVIPRIIEYSIKEQAGKIINEIIHISNIEQEVINNDFNITQLDQMYYSLIDIHRSGQFDIFNF